MVHPDVFPKQVVSPNVQGVVMKTVDVGNQFKNKQELESRDQMLQWIRMKASKLGFSVVIGRSDNGSNRRCVFMTMTCNISKKYRTPLWNFKKDDIGSRRFGHPSLCRLMPEEKECTVNMTLHLVQPKNILATLKRKRPKSDNSYMSRYRTCEDGASVIDIFWIHPSSIKLFNMFSTTLILDSTYKTNKYRLLLLEMVGVTSTEKTYSVGFSFLESEKRRMLLGP
ncbi:uncharacterized protein LOC127091723 [Lathyrus oleraceus]|uniref:uncharacterized protein LOC127091723 n=1 Tax=Pisum sativum TaxID=3888 RepID=UPI0021D3242D|nr:uncharacterized protein LOC127091723 [Pisum sativum]